MKRQALILWLLLPFAWLSAQTATISGTVTDAAGAVQANLNFSVFALDSSNTLFFQTNTDASGNYSVQIPVSSSGGTPVFFLYNNCTVPNYTDSLGWVTASFTYNFTACVGPGGNQCDASFNVSSQSPVPLTASFNALFQGYSSYRWFFGDGNTSNQPNPTHTYASAGAYNVMLAVADSTTGCVDTTGQTIIVANPGGGNCIAIFSATPAGIHLPSSRGVSCKSDCAGQKRMHAL